tara:strand:+ start:1393 stop:1638 length:246 start_codon:yes stop_codon:yes gene_type:complete
MEYVIVAVVIVALGFHLFSKKEVAKSKPASKPSVSSKSTPSVAELKKLTKLQLLAIADRENIKVKRSGSKAEVVKSIIQHK